MLPFKLGNFFWDDGMDVIPKEFWQRQYENKIQYQIMACVIHSRQLILENAHAY
jgi:hypothetical protein